MNTRENRTQCKLTPGMAERNLETNKDFGNLVNIHDMKQASATEDCQECKGRHVALLVAYQSVQEKYLKLRRAMKHGSHNMNTSLNQLDSPTEADQFQMLLEFKCKECDLLMEKVKAFSLLEKKYTEEIQSGQENLRYAIEENERITSQLESIIRQNEGIKEKGESCRHCREESLRVLDDNVISRGAMHPFSVMNSEQFHSTCEQNLLRQIKTLTLEKKQLMTHVHWLTNELRNKDVKLSDVSKKLNQYNVNATSHSFGMNRVKRIPEACCNSLEEGTQNVTSEEHHCRIKKVNNSTQTGENEGLVDSEQVVHRMKKLFTQLTTLKSALQDNLAFSGSLQNSAIQSVRHPFEPHLYSKSAHYKNMSPNLSPHEPMTISAFPSKVRHQGNNNRHLLHHQLLSKTGEDYDPESQYSSVYHSLVVSPQESNPNEKKLFRAPVMPTIPKKQYLRRNGNEELFRIIENDKKLFLTGEHDSSYQGADMFNSGHPPYPAASTMSRNTCHADKYFYERVTEKLEREQLRQETEMSQDKQSQSETTFTDPFVRGSRVPINETIGKMSPAHGSGQYLGASDSSAGKRR